MSIHHLKIDNNYLDSIKNGQKRAEVRNNDRDYRAGDILYLHPKCGGEAFLVTVLHILTHDDFPDGLRPGYAVLSIKRHEEGSNDD